MSEFERAAPFGVFGAGAAFMLLQALVQIIGDAGIKRAVCAFQNV